MKKSFEEIAMEIVKMWITANTDSSGYCTVNYDINNIDFLTNKVTHIADELHANYLRRESNAFDRIVEEELSR